LEADGLSLFDSEPFCFLQWKRDGFFLLPSLRNGKERHMSARIRKQPDRTARKKQHPYGKTWQPFDEVTFADLVKNVAERGLDKDIVLFNGMVLDGWHRYRACLKTKTQPKFTVFTGTDLQAAELVHASGIRRQVSADQRYAAFDQLCDACPEFKAKYEQLKAKGQQQQQAGTPLATSSQRVDVLGAKAKAAGVSKATAKKVERLKKQKPEAIGDIAAGKTTANKELKTLPKKKEKAKAQRKQKKPQAPMPVPDRTTIIDDVAGVRFDGDGILTITATSGNKVQIRATNLTKHIEAALKDYRRGK
jgi:hypothetical protein